MDFLIYKKFADYNNSELANYYVNFAYCRGFCVLCRFYKKCSYEMGVQKYCERKLRN